MYTSTKVTNLTKVANLAKKSGTTAMKVVLTLALVAALNVTGTNHAPSGRASSAEAAAPSSDLPTAAVSSPLPNYQASAISLRHWDKQTVEVYVDPSGDSMKDPQQVLSSVSKGLGLWNAKLGSAIRLETTPDRENADITLCFVAPGTLSGGAVGRTDVTFHLDDQVLTRACVRINSQLPDTTLVQVSAHELGHALGIQGHSPDKHDLMYPYAHLPAEVTDRDLGTMAISYKINPTSTSAIALAAPRSHVGHDSESDSALEFAAPAH